MKKLIFDPYITYGLNRKRAFLPSPDETIKIADRQERMNFLTFLVMQTECKRCAVFVVNLDETYTVVFKIPAGRDERGNKRLGIGMRTSKDRLMFAQMDGDIRFCCYSLLIEVSEGEYEVMV